MKSFSKPCETRLLKYDIYECAHFCIQKWYSWNIFHQYHISIWNTNSQILVLHVEICSLHKISKEQTKDDGCFAITYGTGRKPIFMHVHFSPCPSGLIRLFGLVCVWLTSLRGLVLHRVRVPARVLVKLATSGLYITHGEYIWLGLIDLTPSVS